MIPNLVRYHSPSSATTSTVVPSASCVSSSASLLGSARSLASSTKTRALPVSVEARSSLSFNNPISISVSPLSTTPSSSPEPPTKNKGLPESSALMASSSEACAWRSFSDASVACVPCVSSAAPVVTKQAIVAAQSSHATNLCFFIRSPSFLCCRPNISFGGNITIFLRLKFAIVLGILYGARDIWSNEITGGF